MDSDCPAMVKVVKRQIHSTEAGRSKLCRQQLDSHNAELKEAVKSFSPRVTSHGTMLPARFDASGSGQPLFLLQMLVLERTLLNDWVSVQYSYSSVNGMPRYP